MKQNFWQKLKKQHSPILTLAPMAGITDSPFRQICKSFGADVVYTEMVSADGLAYGSKKTMDLLKFDEKERPIILQLFGKTPANFKKAIKVVQNLNSNTTNISNISNNFLRPDGFDINFGCPARKVVGHGGGVSLMRDLKLCQEIVKAVCDSANVPVSVKIRTSIDKVTALDFLKKIGDLPISAVMIHGRSYEQGFSGDIDFEMIKKIVEKYGDKWLILGNGGLNSAEDVKEMIEKTGVDGVGLARGVLGRPWLFREITYEFANGCKLREYANINWAKIKRVVLKHAKLAYKCKGEHGIIEMRKHLAWYVKGRPDARELRRKLVRVETVEEIEEILDESKT